MRSVLLGVVACVTLASSAHAQSSPGTRTIRRTGASGQEIRVFTYTPHRSDCSATGDAQISVAVNPAHGTVTVRPGSVVAGPSQFGAVDCSGRTLAGTGVWYLPQPGFRGSDRFEYDVTTSNGRSHDTAIIEVQ